MRGQIEIKRKRMESTICPLKRYPPIPYARRKGEKMPAKLFAILGTLLLASPIFKLNLSYVGNPLKEQRDRKRIKNEVCILTFFQVVGLICLIYSIVIA